MIPNAQFPMTFDGATYVPERDQVRLSRQMQAVFDLMKDGYWRTLGRISQVTCEPEASISARLRDFRKARFGSHTVERRHMGDGLFEYRLEVRK